MFLAMASLLEPRQDLYADPPAKEFPLGGALKEAYRRLAAPGEQWPPRPEAAFFGLHRAGIWTVHGPDGQPLNRSVCRKPRGPANGFLAILDGQRVRTLADVRTRPYLLAAAFFQFCPRQREALAAAWDELEQLLQSADTYARYADLNEGLPITPPVFVWNPLEKPPLYERLEDYEDFFWQILKSDRRQIHLLGQIPLDSELLQHIGRLLRTAGADAERYRTTISVYLVWCGILHYADGNFWEYVRTSIGLPENDYGWGEIFERTLKRLDLPNFKDEKGFRFVTPILAHGGIPVSCLDDFFENLVLPVAEGQFGELKGQHVLREWRRDRDLVAFRHKSVSRFLQRGGPPAEDFFERCLRMARQYLETGEILPASALGLPGHVVEAFQNWLKGPVEARPAKHLLRSPYLELQPGTRLVLHLPAQRILLEQNNVPHVVWKVGRHLERACVLHDRGQVLETEPEILDWDRPREAVRCALVVNGQALRSWTLDPFLAPGDSWVFLDVASGRPLPEGPLPRSDVWLLGRVAVEGTGLREVAELPPLAVDGSAWPLHCLDLRRLQGELQVRQDDRIRTYDCEPPAPWLEGGYLVAGIESGSGAPVYQQAPPDLCLPRDETGPALLDGWTLVLQPLAESYPTGIRAYRMEQLAGILGVESDFVRLPLRRLLPEDAAGRFEVTVTGPLGRDHSFPFTLLPEMELSWHLDEADPAVEIRCPDGLFRPERSAEWIEVGDGHLKVRSTPELRFLTGSLEAARTGTEVRIPLRIWVPIPRWRVSGITESSQAWTRTVIRLPLESVGEADSASLWIESPPGSVETLQIALEAAGDPLQVQRALAGPRGQVCLPLGIFKETVRHSGRSGLQVTLQFPVDGAFRKVTMVALRRSWAPPSLELRYIRRNGSRFLHLSWESPSVVTDRALRIYSLWRPDMEPLDVPVPDGASAVEISLGRLPPGRYRLEFTTLDPWCTGPVSAGEARHLDILPEEWERHLSRSGDSPPTRLERLLALLDCPDMEHALGTPRESARALCHERSWDELGELLALLAKLKPEQSARVWSQLIPFLPLDERGVRLLLDSSARLEGTRLLELTLQAGLAQAQPGGLDEALRRRLRQLWPPYGRLFTPPQEQLDTRPLAQLVAQGPTLGWGATRTLQWVAAFAPHVRQVLELLKKDPVSDLATDRLLKTQRLEEQRSGRWSYRIKNYFEFDRYAGELHLMTGRKGPRALKGPAGTYFEGVHLVPLSKITHNPLFDPDFAARFTIAAAALGQRVRARSHPTLAPAADLLRCLGWQSFLFDRNFYGDCIGVRLSTANPEISGSIHVWVQEFVEEVRL
jgi:hypothetical protein